MNFLKTLRVLAFGFFAAALLAFSPSLAIAGITNFGGIAVGDESAGTYVELTGVALEYKELPLGSILTGTNGTTALADTAITTGLYVKTLTGATNTAAVAFPAVLNTGVASIKHRVPWNYRSGGQLLVWCHTNVTFTAGALSITANAFGMAPNALTVTTLAAGTAVQVSTTASTQIVPIVATNSAVYLTPGGQVTWKLSQTVTSSLVGLEVVGLDFIYRPWSVKDGR